MLEIQGAILQLFSQTTKKSMGNFQKTPHKIPHICYNLMKFNKTPKVKYYGYIIDIQYFLIKCEISQDFTRLHICVPVRRTRMNC